MNSKKQKSPFFSRFLEAQKLEKEASIQGGGGPTSISKDLAHTLKYPSDGDDYAVTQKYPSDGDDGIAL